MKQRTKEAPSRPPPPAPAIQFACGGEVRIPVFISYHLLLVVTCGTWWPVCESGGVCGFVGVWVCVYVCVWVCGFVGVWVCVCVCESFFFG